MSTFIVSKSTIDRAMTLMWIEGKVSTVKEATEMGRMALLMNVDAFAQCYPNQKSVDLEKAKAEALKYVFQIRW